MMNRQAKILKAIENRLLDNGSVTINVSSLEAISTAINAISAIEQFKWERDIAIEQLGELGISFGEKIDGVYLTKEKYQYYLDCENANICSLM